MIKLSFSKAALCLSVIASLISCTHRSAKNEEARTPASQASLDHAHISDAEAAELKTAVTNQDSSRLQELLLGERIAQTLVSSFDARLAKAKQPAELEALMKSELYCKISEVRGHHERLEGKLLIIAKQVYDNKESSKDWFYAQVQTFAKQGPVQQVAAIHLLRQMVGKEKKICHEKNCVADDVKKLKGFAFPPLYNRAFSKYIKDHKKELAQYADTIANDSKPGSCFQESRRLPNQTTTYDWKNRTWVGSVLPAGEFVITYDDGPDEVNTRLIRDVWAEAKMEKPSFFWKSDQVVALPEIVKELNDQGYTIGSHTERHADLGNMMAAATPENLNARNKFVFAEELEKVPAEEFEQWKLKTLDREINQAVETLSKTIGKPVYYFRLPYGSGLRNEQIGARFEALDLDNFFWRVDSLDWQDTNPESIFERVTAQMKVVKSGIILFHDVRPQTVEAAKLIVKFLQENPEWKAVPLKSLPGLKEHTR